MMATKIDAKIKILNWISGSVIYESSRPTLKEAVVEATLYGATLYGATLYGATLYGADLREADLREADLREADLRGATLYGADLRGADLENLPQDFINKASRDILFVLEHLRSEVPSLREKLIAGEVDGSQYDGECACLIGTLGKANGGVDKVCDTIPFYTKGIHNPSENWFLNIRKGDTPETNQFAAHALRLIDMVLGSPMKTKVGRTKK